MTVEVMLAREPRRRWSDEAKAQILSEAMAPDAVVAEVARRHRVSPGLIFTWRSRMARRCTAREPTRFLPVQIEEAVIAGAGTPRPPRPAGQLEVVLRNGRVLRLPLISEPERVAALARALET